MKNILTLAEALKTIKTDNDYDGEIKDTLPEIDRQIWVATGIKWEGQETIEPIAKTLAKIKLRLLLGYSTNPEQDKARETYCTKQLQALAVLISQGYVPEEEPEEAEPQGEVEDVEPQG